MEFCLSWKDLGFLFVMMRADFSSNYCCTLHLPVGALAAHRHQGTYSLLSIAFGRVGAEQNLRNGPDRSVCPVAGTSTHSIKLHT
jgi:hypothetical protein